MFGWEKAPTARGTGKRGNVSFTHSPKPLPSFGVLKESRQVRNSAEAPRDLRSVIVFEKWFKYARSRLKGKVYFRESKTALTGKFTSKVIPKHDLFYCRRRCFEVKADLRDHYGSRNL